jgi:hypothetical protein
MIHIVNAESDNRHRPTINPSNAENELNKSSGIYKVKIEYHFFC